MSRSRHTTTATKPLSAVSYMRATSAMGAYTISNQRAAIQAYANAHGIEIAQEYCDGEDEADDPEPRPAYHRLLQDIEHSPGNVSTILIADWTRWTRSNDLHEVFSVEIRLRRAGVSLTAVTPAPMPEEIFDALLAQHPGVTPAVIYLPPLNAATRGTLADSLLAYASLHGMSILRVYRDDGDRPRYPAFQQLLDDVASTTRTFTTVLLPHPSWTSCDASLPDIDLLTSVCQQYGVTPQLLHPEVLDEPFTATIVKLIKQYMAGEYSRTLSTRVLARAKQLGNQGVYLGGKAGFGYRRMLVEHDGTHVGLLEDGARKALATQHVTLVPGPEQEITLVNWMYRQVAEEGLTVAQLVQRLAARGAVTDQGRAWTRATVRTVLTSPRYIGTLVHNKTNTQLGSRRRLNGMEDIITVPNAFPGIVPRALYDRVQAALAKQ